VNTSRIFSIRTKKEFKKMALQIFYLQAEKNLIYKEYVKKLGINPKNVKRIEQIPFLPVEFFKTREIITTIRDKSTINKNRKLPKLQITKPILFLSSGTTGMERSKHYVSNIKMYESSFRICFKKNYGDIRKYTILAFLPSYYENKNSSLLYMVNDLIKRSKKIESRFYQQNEQAFLNKTLNKLLLEKRKVILFGVPYALLDFKSEISKQEGGGLGKQKRKLIILETGGMKGKHKEITREELHEILSEKFFVTRIHSEYGMTELLSQAYSNNKGIFYSPPWMKILIRDPKDPFSFLPNGITGAINIIDLANIYSCSFIATQDVGKIRRNNSFEVLGRIDNSDLRGCNLLVN
jgi:hypothetical protein